MFKHILIACLLVVSVVLATFMLKIIFFPINTFDTSINASYDIVDKTLTADNAIYNYEWFKKQEESIKALYKKADRATKDIEEYLKTFPDVKNWDIQTQQEYSRLNSIQSGLGNQLDDAIADYNAKSNMVNKNIFKDNLPSNLSKAFYAGQQLTN